MYANYEEEIDLFAISEKIGSVENIGSIGSAKGSQPLPISKKMSSSEKIGSSAQLKVGDRVKYIGETPSLQKQYAGVLQVHEVSNDGYACLKPDGGLTSWIEAADLRLVEN